VARRGGRVRIADVPHVLLAGVLAQTGRHAEALAELDEAVRLIARNGERFWEPEVYRFRGELLHGTRAPADGVRGHATARESVQRALAVACAQQSPSLQLRAAISLFRCADDPAERERVQGQIAELLGGFTEGLETRDLVEARALIDRRSGRYDRAS
jgi:hypothetical protein